MLLLLSACKDERAVLTLEPADAVEVSPAPEAKTSTTSSTAEVEVAPTARRGPPIAAHGRALRARAAILGTRKKLGERTRSLETRVSRLEGTLKVTGPRNDQRDVLSDLGRSRGELAKVRATRARCERAFDGDEWSEIEAAWLLAEDLRSEGERDAAEENYQRFMTLVADFRAHCEELEPIKGAR
jgi:hypothetical protein